MTDVRKELQRALKRSGKTRYWLAKKSGVRLGTVYDYMSGKNDMTGAIIAKLMEALDLEIRPKGKR